MWELLRLFPKVCNDLAEYDSLFAALRTAVPILASMDEMDLNLLLEQPVWQQVLEIYQELINQAGQERSEEDQGVRWAKRIAELDAIDPDELSKIHGQLIAYGWLTFQLEDRNSGLMYRITKDGRKACEAVLKAMRSEESAAA